MGTELEMTRQLEQRLHDRRVLKKILLSNLHLTQLSLNLVETNESQLKRVLQLNRPPKNEGALPLSAHLQPLQPLDSPDQVREEIFPAQVQAKPIITSNKRNRGGRLRYKHGSSRDVTVFKQDGSVRSHGLRGIQRGIFEVISNARQSKMKADTVVMKVRSHMRNKNIKEKSIMDSLYCLRKGGYLVSVKPGWWSRSSMCSVSGDI